MRRGRPKHSSYRSYQLMYARLLKGPLYLEDWKSTGLKSRSTVHKRLKYLTSRGLVKRRRVGHKIVYEIAPLKTENGIITYESILWHMHLYPVSRKEKREIERNFKKHARELMRIEKELTSGLRRMAEIYSEIDIILDLPKSKEVFDALREGGLDWKDIPIPNLLKFLLNPHLADQLCIDCLRKGEISYYITDHETGEVICPKEGVVVKEEPIWAH